MRKLRPLPKIVASSAALPKTAQRGGETEELRRRLAEAEAELSFFRSKHEWLVNALATQRHARQLLEAGVSASYADTISRIREVVRSLIPPKSTIIVISKGDQDLVRFNGRQAWHFPQNEAGIYAGHYPADSSEAIAQLKSLTAKGGEFLLVPNTAFWWLEHYRELKEWLELSNRVLWRDERCAIYKLTRETSPLIDRIVFTPNPAEIDPLSFGSGTASPQVDERRLSQHSKRSDILCFPIIDWDFRFQRPQQLMLRFAAGGHRVFYLSHRFRKSGAPYLLRLIKPSLWEVSLRGLRCNLYQGLLDDGFRDHLFQALSELQRDLSLETAMALLQSPFWWPLAKKAASAFQWRTVYDCMDYHAGFSASNPVLIEQERELLSQVDLVVTSSALLQNQAQQYARKVALVRNACDYEHFAKAGSKPNGKRPAVGYYGAIADWFDSDLVADLAERRREWDFILVGSTLSADLRRLSKLPNVSLPGEKPYAEIPAWLARFDVAILPFKRTPLTEAANPVKAYEIFASGKPLVSVPLPEMLSLAPLARLASTVDEFERAIRQELGCIDLPAKRKRRAFARSNTWDKRFQQLSTLLGNIQRMPHNSNGIRPGAQIPASFV
jgi:hypothetical protein